MIKFAWHRKYRFFIFLPVNRKCIIGLNIAFSNPMKLKNQQIIIFLTLSLLAFVMLAVIPAPTAFALEREYVVRMAKADWQTDGKKNYECSLWQKIPFYGEGRFTHQSGHEVRFDLYSDTPVMQDARVILQSEPPPWRHDDTVFEIAKLDFSSGHNPLTVNHPYASRMFQQLENGMSPVIIYRDLADGRDIIAVMLSPIHFRKVLAKYRECEQSLMDFDLERIKKFRLYFATNKAELTSRSKRDLDNVLRYLKINPKIKQIRIDAHADARGRRRFNDKLAERRSESVVKYLVSIGAKRDMIYAVSHGEREPTFSNKTAQGRSKNRRADVQLLETPPPTLEEQKAMEVARKAERRRLLREKSIFNKPPVVKKPASDKQSDNNPAAAQQDMQDNPEQESVPIDDEPPPPNFINLDHLIDKNTVQGLKK